MAMNAYTAEEQEAIWWMSKRLDNFGLLCGALALAAWLVLPESSAWRIFVIVGTPPVIWSNWATLGVRGNLIVWVPFLAALVRYRAKSLAKEKI